jgi:Skp family chaperone for outer membrane proteins
LEAIAHKIHTKADNAGVQDLFQALKKEVVDSVAKLKKDQKQKKQTDKKKAEETAQAAFDESQKCAEKILKLAN